MDRRLGYPELNLIAARFDVFPHLPRSSFSSGAGEAGSLFPRLNRANGTCFGRTLKLTREGTTCRFQSAKDA